MKFTQASVDRFKMPDGKSEHIEFDDNMPGFGLRVRANGKEHRTFIVQYKIGAKHRRVTLGNVKKVTLENARAEAKRIFGKIAHGKDPAAEKEVFRDKAAHTFGATITKYLEARKGKLRARSYEACRYALEAQWLPLHGLALDSITRAHVAAETSAIAKHRGPSSANRARAVLSAFYRWCIGEGLCDENPVIGTNKQEENGPRERSLSDAEAAAVWLARADNNDYGRIVRL
ncbi:MAG TPA: integrase family protein, partial [Pseudolabrys sp.]